MEVIKCKVSSIAITPAAETALKLMVERVYLVKTSVYLLCKQCLIDKASAGTPLPETDAQLVALFKDAFFILSSPSTIKSQQQSELRTLCDNAFPKSADGVPFSMPTDGFAAAWVLAEAKKFAMFVAGFVISNYSVHKAAYTSAGADDIPWSLLPDPAHCIDTVPMEYLQSFLFMDKYLSANASSIFTPFMATALAYETTMLTSNLVQLLPNRIFLDAHTTRNELQAFLKTIKKPVSTDKKKPNCKAKETRKFNNAQNLIWKLVFDFEKYPFNIGRSFNAKIKTDGENCSIFFQNQVF